MKSLLSNVNSADVFSDPFPHIVIPDAIDPDACRGLMEEFPPLSIVTGDAEFKSNQRFSYPAREALRNDALTPRWREFIGRHVSSEFFREAINVFGRHILARYPHFERDYGPLDRLKTGVRYTDTFDSADVLMDAQICVNTPVVGEASSVRRGHLDRLDKLFAGLFYLRSPHDASSGGDLEIYRLRDPSYQPTLRALSDQHLEVARTVRYEQNVLVMFVNCIDAWHGVSVRSTTDVPRRFVNLVSELPRPLFQLHNPAKLQPAKPKAIPAWSRRILGKLRRVVSFRKSIRTTKKAG